MIHIKKFNELFENVAVHKSVRPEKLPHCSDMQARGYKTDIINGDHYAFHKNYEADDEIYWLGRNTPDYEYKQKYIATQDVTRDKDNFPFYSIYCKCDPGLTDAQKKIIEERDKENLKRQEARKKEAEAKMKKKKSK